MSKLLKIFIIFMITITLFFCIVNAETTNLYNDVQNEETAEDAEIDDESSISTDEEIEPQDNSESTKTSSTSGINTSAKVSALSSIPEANLGLNNILCVILIAIGVLIILLAIAILIRIR